MKTINNSISIRKIASMLALTFFLLFLVDKIVFYFGTQLIAKSTYRFTQPYNNSATITDILILGNSRADQHFPRYEYKELRILNLGNGWVGVPISQAIALDLLESHSPPKKLIIESSFLDYSGTGRAFGAINSIFSERVESAVMLDSSSFQKYARKVFFSLRFNENDLINTVFRIYNKDKKNLNTNSHIISETIKQKALESGRKLEIQPRNKALISNLIRKYKDKGIEVLLVSTPIHHSGIKGYTNIKQYILDLDELAKNTNIRHINLIETYKNDDYFADSLHLNNKGQKAFLDSFFSCHLIDNPTKTCIW